MYLQQVLDVVIDAQPATPSAPVAGAITQPSCATATGSFTITSFESTSTYTFTPSATVDGSGVVTLAAGATYTFTETNAAGCISAASSDVVQSDVQPGSLSAPIAGTITQPTCGRPGRFTIDSYESTSTYTFTPFAYVDTSTGIVTLAAGATYTFTETNAVGCISPVSSDVVIFSAPPCPDSASLTDTDGDGIEDVNDLDDDNDGILDIDEGISCTTSGITPWDPINGLIGTNQITSQPWLNFPPESSMFGVSFSDFTPVMPSGKRTNTNIGFRSITFADPITEVYLGILNLDFHSITLTDHNNNPLTITQIDAHNANISGNVLSDIHPATHSNGLSVDGVFLISSSTPFTVININYTLLFNAIDGHVFSFAFPPTQTCSGTDTDGDGTPDYLDLDSDNDGIADIIESGSTDTNGDGLVDSFTDTDNDGLHDSYDADNGGTTVVPRDTDTDGVADYLDLDADNDGIYDVVEGGDGASDTNNDGVVDSNDTGFVDANSNGMADNTESTTEPDSDTDNIADYLELDSDGDGCNDVAEAGYNDANGDGILGAASPTFNANGTVDTTGTSSAGYNTPADVDGNSVADYTEVGPNNASAETLTACDSLVWNGTTYTTSGTYTYTTTNMSGCDSILTLDLTIVSPVTSNVDSTICFGDSALLGGLYQTVSGSYRDTIVGGASNTCDSIVVTGLTVLPRNVGDTLPLIACDSAVWRGTTYTISGVYTRYATKCSRL